jgi:hypothetical protein
MLHVNYTKCQLLIILGLLFFADYTRAQEPVKIAVWGDSRENADKGTEQVISLLKYEQANWDFQVHTGDFTHAGKEVDWKRSLAYNGMKDVYIPEKFFMCTSNHDDIQYTYDKYTKGVLPVNDTDNTTHFYAHRQGNVHVLFMDAYFTEPEVMQKWLDDYLAKNVKKDDWLIGVWHNPCYGDVTYKDDYLEVCAGWLDSFYKYGGDFILHGHAHVYLRSKPVAPDGSIDMKNGMVHIVSGVGGASWKDPLPYAEKTAYTPDVKSFPAVSFLKLDGNTATVRTLDARPDQNRRVIDEWTWKK